MFDKKTIATSIQDMITLIQDVAKREILPRWWKVIGQQKWEKRWFKDLVTEADKRASEKILNGVRLLFPWSYSEEHKYTDRFWAQLLRQIDPVDGTQEFCEWDVDGYACHATLLQREKDGTYKWVWGIIYQPWIDNLWYYDSEEVVHISEWKRISLPTYDKHTLRGRIRKVDPSQALDRFYHDLGTSKGVPIKVVPWWGSWASFADLFNNKINLLIMNYNYTKERDIAMAEPIIKALGGFLCDFDGNEFTYNRADEPWLWEPYNLRWYIASIAYKKEEILPYLTQDLLINKL